MQVTEIIFVYSDPADRDYISSTHSERRLYIDYVDAGSKLSKKRARTLMTDWGSTKLPFTIVMNKDKVVTCFYSEAEDVLGKTVNLLTTNE